MARLSTMLLPGSEAHAEAQQKIEQMLEEIRADHDAHVVTAWESVGRPWDCGCVGVSVGLISAMDRYREQTGVGLPVSPRSAY